MKRRSDIHNQTPPQQPTRGCQSPFALEIANLTKSFVGLPALSGINMTIAPGEVHALVGVNGSGKSTLIRTLSGYHQPDTGSSVYIDGTPLKFGSPDHAYALGCRFVHQDLGLVDSSSIMDNLSFNSGFPTRMGTVRDRVIRQGAHMDLARLGVTLDPRTPVGELPAALKTTVAVARALRVDRQCPAKLLVLDEPTATLPLDQVEQLLSMIRAVASSGVGVLYVTHDLAEVFAIADNITILRDGQKVATEPASALDRRELISLLVGHELEDAAKVSSALGPPSGPAIISANGLASGPLVSLSLQLRAGDIVGLAGLTGSGRDVVLPAIFGTAERNDGTVLVDDRPLRRNRPDLAIRAGIAYLPASRAEAGIMDFTAVENVTLSDLRPFRRWMSLNLRAERRAAKTWFNRMGVHPADAGERALSTFSGGNQQKILLAKLLRCTPRVLLLDEPTQGVDVAAKAGIHQQVLAAAASGAAIVISSADIDELVALCHRVLVVRDGRIAVDLVGSEVTVGAITRASLGGEQGRAA